MSLRLRWRREERERGLAGTCQGERGYDLMYGNQRVGSARVAYVGWSRNVAGYYHYCQWGGESINTCDELVPTIDEAKAQAMAWARERIQAAPIAGK